MSGDATALLAARIELVALRASLPLSAEIQGDSVLMVPSSTGMSTEQAASHLAALEKPLFCTADLANGTLCVDCQRISSGALADAHELDVRLLDGEWEGDGGLGRWLPSDGILLVEGRGEVLLAPGNAFRRWYRDYHPPPMAMAFGFPTTDERAMGAVYKMKLGSGEQVDTEALPPDLKALWKAVREGPLQRPTP